MYLVPWVGPAHRYLVVVKISQNILLNYNTNIFYIVARLWLITIYIISYILYVGITNNESNNMGTYNATTEEKIIYLESRLDDVERELNIINSRKIYLEEKRKTLLESINKLDEKREDTVHQQLFGI